MAQLMGFYSAAVRVLGRGHPVAAIRAGGGLGVGVGAEMQSRVLDRFGMLRSGMVWRQEFESDQATGYDADGKTLNHRRRKKVDAASSLDTTIRDHSAFLAGIVGGEGAT
jgi:hypothetical protein